MAEVGAYSIGTEVPTSLVRADFPEVPRVVIAAAPTVTNGTESEHLKTSKVTARPGAPAV